MKPKAMAHTSSKPQFFREIDIQFLIHELKDPISVIETSARTLVERQEKFGSLSPRQERTMARILRSTRKAREMLYDLLEIGRSESGCFICCRFQPAASLFQVILDAMEIRFGSIPEELRRSGAEPQAIKLLSNYGLFLDFDPSVFRSELYQDETKFRQIAGNLIRNAMHHRKERIDIKLNVTDNIIYLDVIDDGPGIDSEHHELIFQRYRQVDACSLPTREGHGLGLAGARILARSLGGDIEIMSKKGKGATFRLNLPTSMDPDIGTDKDSKQR